MLKATKKVDKGTALMLISENLRKLRLDRGLTQKQLAEKVGVSYTRISDLERGKGNPTLETLILIADALTTSVASLIENSKI